MVNPDYVDGNPFVLKGEGLPVESINNFILLGGSLEGSVDVVAPSNFNNEEWSNQETPQKALFCNFTLQNMSGTNNNTSLNFNNGQGCIIKSEIFLQLLDKVSKIEFQGTGLAGLTVNVLKNYPAVNPEDTILSNININGGEIALLDSLMDNSSFYLQLIATANNIQVNSITLTVVTMKLGGAANIEFDDSNLRITRVNLTGGDVLPINRADLSGVLPLSASDIPTLTRSKISDLLPIAESDLISVLQTKIDSSLNQSQVDSRVNTILAGNHLAIVAGTDLNTFTSYGIYGCTAIVNATTALNYPVNSKAGVLEVFVSDGIQQRYTAYDSSGVWIRDYYNSAWSAWVKIYPLSASDIPTLTRAKISDLLPIRRDDLSGVLPINRADLSGVLPINRVDLGNVFPLSTLDIPTLTRAKISDLLPIHESDLDSDLQGKIDAPASEVSLYKFAPASVASFTFDATHGIPSALNHNQRYKIHGVFKTSAVSNIIQTYIRFNGDTASHYTYQIQPIHGTDFIPGALGTTTTLPITTSDFPHTNIVAFFDIEFISMNGDYTFVETTVTARDGTTIWKWVSSAMWLSTVAITSVQVAMSNVTTPSTSYAELSTSGVLTY